jgi:hypothetical protein
MPAQDTQRALQWIDERLNCVVTGLVQNPFDLEACWRSLEGVTTLLDRIKPEALDRSSSTEMLRQIQATTKRVHALLDSAANFYCGSLCAAMPSSETYTSEGQIARSLQSGNIKIEG